MYHEPDIDKTNINKRRSHLPPIGYLQGRLKAYEAENDLLNLVRKKKL